MATSLWIDSRTFLEYRYTKIDGEGFMSQRTFAVSTDQLGYTAAARRSVVLYAFAATLFDGADFFIFIYFLHPIASYFGTSLVAITTIQAISYLTGIIGGIFFGIIADRRGRRTGLGLAVATYSIFTFISAFSGSFNALLIWRALAGIGIGGESGIAFAYLNEAYHHGKSHRGTFCGALSTMFIFGGLVATGLFHVTSLAYGHEAWRWAFGYFGLLVILAGLIFKYMPESRLWLESRSQERSAFPVVDIFRQGMARVTILGTIMMTFCFFGCYAILTFQPTLWASVYRLSPSTVAQLGYLGMTLAVIAQFGAGWLADVLGRKTSFALCAVVGTVGYLFFLAVGPLLKLPVTEANVWTSLPFFAFIIMMFGFGYIGVQGSWFAELYPTHARTTGQNFVYYVSRAFGAGIGPLLALSLATEWGFDVRMAIALGVIGAAGTGLVSRMLPETRGAELRNE